MNVDVLTLREQPLSFERPCPELANGEMLDAGYFYEENGDILLKLCFPSAETVTIRTSPGENEILLIKDGGGLFEGLIPYDSTLSGPLYLTILVDGNSVIYPYFPVCWCWNRPINYVEMPSPNAQYWEIRDVPHGTVSRELYYSNVLQDWKRCMVYTPPGYTKDTKEYPVVYMLHGGTANELDWIYAGHAAHIFDNLFAERKAAPFIAVMTNGMVRFPDSANVVWDDALEQMLVNDVIPYIDSRYRVLDGKWNRALCGLSMGAYMTNDIGFRHPELFGYMGQFTACMTHLTDFPNYERPYISLMQMWAKDPEEFAHRYRVFFRSTTTREDHFDYFEADDAIISKTGIAELPCNHRVVYPNMTSKWDSWRLGLRDFVQLLF